MRACKERVRTKETEGFEVVGSRKENGRKRAKSGEEGGCGAPLLHCIMYVM